MSLQVFLQAQLLGTEQFLVAHSGLSEPVSELFGRCAWLTLFCEVLPRALLRELKLSRMLLGSSSAEQFLLVLTEDDIDRAAAFLARSAESVSVLSGNTLRLVWATTENLGPWPIARKRLDDALAAAVDAPLSAQDASNDFFRPFVLSAPAEGETYFSAFSEKLSSAQFVGWSDENPAQLTWDSGKFTWPLREQLSPEDEGILFPRRFAMNEAATDRAPLEELASRADGKPHWAILRGDVDHFDLQLRRAASIEDHLHLSGAFKDFLAGELSLLCTLGDFWQKVNILYRGGNSFALLGTWDALIMLAREMQRIFERFIAHNFESLPSVEAKTVTMALSIAPELHSSPSAIFQEAGASLAAAKATDLGSFHLFGRTLEWKRLNEAEELKTGLVRLVRDYGYPAATINDLASVYREAFSARAGRRAKGLRIDRPWRTYMRVARVIPPARSREMAGIRNAVIGSLVGTRTTNIKLRPSGRIGLEWARISAGA